LATHDFTSKSLENLQLSLKVQNRLSLNLKKGTFFLILKIGIAGVPTSFEVQKLPGRVIELHLKFLIQTRKFSVLSLDDFNLSLEVGIHFHGVLAKILKLLNLIVEIDYDLLLT